MLQPIASARIRWLPASRGGRSEPPPGPVYATTAQFEGDGEDFSVILRFAARPSHQQNEEQEAELVLLAPDLLPDIADRMAPGVKLRIKEGRRTVAECELVSVRTAEVGPAFGGPSNEGKSVGL